MLIRFVLPTCPARSTGLSFVRAAALLYWSQCPQNPLMWLGHWRLKGDMRGIRGCWESVLQAGETSSEKLAEFSLVSPSLCSFLRVSFRIPISTSSTGQLSDSSSKPTTIAQARCNETLKEAIVWEWGAEACWEMHHGGNHFQSDQFEYLDLGSRVKVFESQFFQRSCAVAF